jgi:hypothetical protein
MSPPPTCASVVRGPVNSEFVRGQYVDREEPGLLYFDSAVHGLDPLPDHRRAGHPARCVPGRARRRLLPPRDDQGDGRHGQEGGARARRVRDRAARQRQRGDQSQAAAVRPSRGAARDQPGARPGRLGPGRPPRRRRRGRDVHAQALGLLGATRQGAAGAPGLSRLGPAQPGAQAPDRHPG